LSWFAYIVFRARIQLDKRLSIGIWARGSNITGSRIKLSRIIFHPLKVCNLQDNRVS
jgi:hypothetical protein